VVLALDHVAFPILVPVVKDGWNVVLLGVIEFQRVRIRGQQGLDVKIAIRRLWNVVLLSVSFFYV
jgi:hypothetical protein